MDEWKVTDRALFMANHLYAIYSFFFIELAQSEVLGPIFLFEEAIFIYLFL